jgi:hypothetical protein
MPALYNKEVELIIIPKERRREKKEEYSALDFLREFSGILKDLPKEDINDARYEYLIKKYDIKNQYISDEDLDNARNNYLTEKYK